MSRSRPLTRDRGQSFLKEELVEESPPVLVDRFLTGISNCFANGVNQSLVRQITEALNVLVKHVGSNRPASVDNPPFQCDERVLQGLQLGLLSQSTSLRAACARALRYCVTSNREFAVLVKMNANIYISRCIDTVSPSSVDYYQVIRLISSLFRLASRRCSAKEVVDFFNIVISSCCSSILQDPVPSWQQNHLKSPKQQLVVPRKLTAEIISEACLIASAPYFLPSPQMLHSLMAVALSESFYLSVNEAIVGVFVHMLNYPHTRRIVYSSGCLESLIAKFSDDTVSPDVANNTQNQQQNEDRTPTFQWKAAQFTLTKLFHSCPGAWALLGGNYCRELLNGLAPPMGFEPGADNGGFFIKSRVSTKRIKRQRELLSLLAAIFNVETPQWTTDISAAILSTDSRKYDESWTVHEGYIAAEAEDLLYHSFSHRFLLANPPPTPASTLMALILAAFVDAHLVTALATFAMSCLQYSFRGTKPSQKGGVVQTDPHFTEVECLGVTSAVILGHILHQAKRLLSNGSSALEEIEDCTAAFHTNLVTAERQDVIRTVFDVIGQTEDLLTTSANKPSSLHLELILRYCPKITGPNVIATGPILQENRPRSQSSTFNKQLLESTGLLTGVPTVNAITWPSIRLLLNLSTHEVRRSVSESDLVTALRNLASFYKSTGSFCHTDLSSALRNGGRTSSTKPKNRLADIAHSAISLIDFLLAGTDAIPTSPDSAPPSLGVPSSVRGDYYRIAGDLIGDICKTLNSVATNPQCPAGENGVGYISLGSLPRVGAQFWFAILGACTSSAHRQTLLEENRSGAFEVLRLFVENPQSTEVMRLAISFLNFAVSEPSRQLLALALKSPEDEIRHYAVQLITSLWQRIDDPFSFAKWAVPLITPLIADSQWRVSDTTVNALLDTVLLCPVAGSIVRSLKPTFRLEETSHRLLYGCCIVSPGAWQVHNTKKAMNREIDFWITESYHVQYSQFCDEMFVELFSGCFSRHPGSVEHYSNLKSGRKVRLPGRHFPPSILKVMARSQLGVHFLGLKATEFVKRCCEIVSYYAEAGSATIPEQKKYSSETVASIRSSICVLANISSNPLGADWISSCPCFEGFNIVAAFHALSQTSPVFSVRGTALIGLSVVADCVDPDLLCNCQWVDQRRRAALVPFFLSAYPKLGRSPAMSRKQTLLSIPDISIEQLGERNHQNSGHLSPNPFRRRSSTTNIPPIAFEPSSLSSSSSSSINSMVVGSGVDLNAGNRSPLLVRHQSPLAIQTSLPVTTTTTTAQRPVSLAAIESHPPSHSPGVKRTFTSKISNMFKRSHSSKTTNAPSSDHGKKSPLGRTRSTAEPVTAAPTTRGVSLSSEQSQSSSTSIDHSEAFFPSGEGDNTSFHSLNMLDFTLPRLGGEESGRQNDENEKRPPSRTKAFFNATPETSDFEAAASIFYLPAEEMTSFPITGVFLPENVSELLQDTVTNVLGFKPDVVTTPVLPRKMSVISMSANNANSQSCTLNNKAGTNEAHQLFPPGEASNMIFEHTAHCLVCCLREAKKAAITDEWQQVLWLVVSLQIWPNRTPKMLLSYFANNRHLPTDGCLYSEVVNVMSKIALSRQSRQFVHSLFDAMSFSELVVAARELNPSVV